MSQGPDAAAGAASAPFDRITPAFRPGQVEKTAPCQTGCPNCGDIRGWIGTVAQRDKLGLSLTDAYARAWRMITDVNPFPSVLGRVCPHPCETKCNRGEKDGAVGINSVERFIGDYGIEKGLKPTMIEGEEAKKEKKSKKVLPVFLSTIRHPLLFCKSNTIGKPSTNI